ncbi:MAG: sulfatase [Segetibacter sp.]|nr:sulfatase [Segetibacter sp.]
MSDDHSKPYVGCYGNQDIKTPNLDRLAGEGIKFTRAYTTAPQCVPSRASLMTGRSVLAVSMSRFTAPLQADFLTYPELLKKAGYYTGICGRSFHLDGLYNVKESQEIFDKYKLQTFKKRVDYLQVNGEPDRVLNDFISFLNQVPATKPFFIQVGYNDPHRPYTTQGKQHVSTNIKVPASMPNTPLVKEDLAKFYSEIEHLDGEIGRLLAEVKKRGLDKNTLIVFMGDNGAALLRGKGTLYNTGLNVPLIMRYPIMIKPQQTSEAMISGEDIAPTFLDMAGVQIPKNMTGQSMMPALKGNAYNGHEYVFAVRVAHGSALPTNTANFDLGRTVFTDKFKLIYNVLWQLPYSPVDFSGQSFWLELERMHKEGKLETRLDKAFFAEHRSMFELYDLKADPDEFTNLSGKAAYMQIENKLKGELHKWMILNHDYVPLPVTLPRNSAAN